MTNDLQPQPQDDAPLPQIPFLPDDPMPIETKVPDSTRAQVRLTSVVNFRLR